MGLPDVTTNPAEWDLIRSTTRPSGGLWKNNVHANVYSTDGGMTFTISTTREHHEKPRDVYPSRKV